MAGTAKTRAALTELAGNPFRQTAQPTNADFQDLVASLFNLLDDDAENISVDAVTQALWESAYGADVLPEDGAGRLILIGLLNKLLNEHLNLISDLASGEAAVAIDSDAVSFRRDATSTPTTVTKKLRERPTLFDWLSDTQKGYIEAKNLTSQDASANVYAFKKLREAAVSTRGLGVVNAGPIAVDDQLGLWDGATLGGSGDDQLCHLIGEGNNITSLHIVSAIPKYLFDIQNCWRHSSEAGGIGPTYIGGFDPEVYTCGIRLGGFSVFSDRALSVQGIIRLYKICDYIHLHDITVHAVKGCAFNLGYDDSGGLSGYGTLRECKFERLVHRHSGDPGAGVPASYIAHGSANGDGTNQLDFDGFEVIYPWGIGLHCLNDDTDQLRRIKFRHLWLHGLYTDRASLGAPAADLMVMEGKISGVDIDGLQINGTLDDGAGAQYYGIRFKENASGAPTGIQIRALDAKTCLGGVLRVEKAGGGIEIAGHAEGVSIKGEMLGMDTSAVGRLVNIDIEDLSSAPLYQSAAATYDHTTNVWSSSLEVRTGSRVTLNNSGGALPSDPNGYDPHTDYWAIWVSSSTFKLADSKADAEAGTARAAAADDGTGTHTATLRHIGARETERKLLRGNWGSHQFNPQGDRSLRAAGYYNNVPATLAETALNAPDGGALGGLIEVLRDGALTGLSAVLSEAITSGTITLHVKLKGANLLSTAINSTTGTVKTATWAPDRFELSAGDVLQVYISAAGPLAPTTIDVRCNLEISA